MAVLLGLAFAFGPAVALLSGSSSTISGGDEPRRHTAPPEVIPGELLVKFRPGVAHSVADAVLREQGATMTRRFRAPRRQPDAAAGRWWHLQVPLPGDTRRVLGALLQSPLVEAAEPSYVVHITRTPDDPLFPELWGLHNTGASGGEDDADIDAPEAWEINRGATVVVVAVIDTGIDYRHPDLAANMWINPGEIPDNGLDDDGNGYADDVHGYDFCNDDPDPDDDHGHGTHVAGTMAAVGDNGVGVVGVNWTARVMAVKFLCGTGGGGLPQAIASVLYATDLGVRVSNNSWGGGGYSQALYDAIVASHEAGTLFVAAAGNAANDNDKRPFYPANYEVPNVLAVAATDRQDALAWFSNYGANTVGLGAPGVDILSTLPVAEDPTGYGRLNGTSMASPHVAGAATLLLATHPARSATGLKALLMGTTDPIPALASKTGAGGRLNLHRALTCQPDRLFLQTPRRITAYQGEPQPLRAALHVCDTPAIGAVVTASFSTGDPPVTLRDDGAQGDDAANDGIYAASWTPAGSGPLTLTFAATHPDYGEGTTAATGEVRVPFVYDFAPAPFTWDDITAGGTHHEFRDDWGETIAIGFPFRFFGIDYSTVTISDNGYLTFGDFPWIWFNHPIPARDAPHNFIAPYWDDLFMAGGVYSRLDGVAPGRRLTVTWLDMPHYGVGGKISFQLVLREGAEDIEMRYLDVMSSEAGADRWYYDNGLSATVGVENDDGTHGTQFSYNEPVLQDQTALVFFPAGQATPVAVPGGPYQGSVVAPVAFDGSASHVRGGGTVSEYLWNFGDGATGSGAQPSHTYARAGLYRVELVVRSGAASSVPATTTVSVDGIQANTPPDARDDAVTVAEDQGASLDVLANDVNADADQWLITAAGDASAGGRVVVAGERIQYLPAANFHGVETFTYTVADRAASSDTATVTVTVTPVNDRPQASSEVFATPPEDSSVSFSPMQNCCSDADGDAITLVSIGTPQHGTAYIWQPGWINYFPDPNYHGPDSFTYTVSDGIDTATGTVELLVLSVNDAPYPNDDAVQATEDAGAIRIAVLANDYDIEGDPLTVLGVEAPPRGTAAVDGSEVVYEPDAEFSGTDSFIYTIRDGEGATAAATVTVSVAAVNDPPVLATNAGLAVTEGELAPILADRLKATDVDTPPWKLFYRVVTPPGAGRLTVFGIDADEFSQANVDDGWVAYLHEGGEAPVDSFGMALEDREPGGQDGAPVTVAVNVNPVNDVPVARGDGPLGLAEDTTLTVAAPGVLANDSDPDGPITAVLVSAPGNAASFALQAGGGFSYTPVANFHGGDSFTYRAYDGHDLSGTVTVALRVDPVPDAPTISEIADQTIDEDTSTGPLGFIVGDADTSPEALALSATSSNPDLVSGSEIAFGGGGASRTVRVTPRANQFGQTLITVAVTDGTGSASESFNVVVRPVDEPPPAAAGSEIGPMRPSLLTLLVAAGLLAGRRRRGLS